MREHLPTGSSTHPEHSKAINAAWIKWRETQLHSQTMLYCRFVSFWMEKYLDQEGSRAYFSYEEFIDGATGPQEAVRLGGKEEEGAVQPLDVFVKRD